MTRRQIFLHIGQPKTGSTSLQFFLHRNREALAARGILYPTTLPGQRLQEKHHCLVENLARMTDRDTAAEPAWSAILQQIDASSASQVVLSDELFWRILEHRPAGRPQVIRWIARQLAGHEVIVVCYLRRQSDWIESRYNQLAKMEATVNGKMPFEVFVDKHAEMGALDYDAVLADWAAAFGAAQLRVRPWEKASLVNGNTIDDFCALLGQSDLSGLRRPPELQLRLGAPALAMAVAFNRQPAALASKARFLKLLSSGPALPRDGQGRWTAEDAAALDQRYEPGNREIARIYCQRESLFSPETSQRRECYDGLSADELAEMMARIFINQQAQIDALQQRLDQLAPAPAR